LLEHSRIADRLSDHLHRSPRHVSFIASFVLAGLLFYITVSPFFGEFCKSFKLPKTSALLSHSRFRADLSMKVFGVMLMTISICGALVGGVIGILLPKLSVGVSLGFLVALNVCSVCSRLQRSLQYLSAHFTRWHVC
jgi:hypothetical protein